MARRGTTGYEIRDKTTSNIDGNVSSGTIPDTVLFRSGSVSLKCNSGASNLTAPAAITSDGQIIAAGASAVAFVRCYYYFTDLPSAATSIMRVDADSTSQFFCGVQCDQNGNLLAYTQNGAAITSSSTSLSAVHTLSWIRIECKVTVSVAVGGLSITHTVNDVLIDGISQGISITDTKNYGSAVTSSISPRMGWIAAPGANKVVNVDDAAWNDDQGTDQNSYPGSGKVVLLLPTATNGSPAAKWTDNDGTQTNMWEGVNNTPPTGTAVTTTPSHLYIKHAGGAAGTTDEFDATMTTYAAAGIGATDTINTINYIVVTGEESATGTKLLAIKGVSNPVVSLGSSFDVFATSGAQGTYPTNWQVKRDGLAIQYNPSVTIASAPVFGVVRPETASRVASVCAMYMYVDYTPPSTPVTGSESDAIPAKSSQIVSVNRASFY